MWDNSPRGRTCARAGQQAPTQPRWPLCLTWMPDLCLKGLRRGMAFTQEWHEASLEELPSPLPGLGLSFLEAPHGIKAHQRFPGKADFFLLSAGTCTFIQAGRVQLQLGAAAQDTASSSVLPPTDKTGLHGAQLGITDESKETLGCMHHSILMTVLPAIPTGGTCLQLCRPTSSPYFRW